jgi:hypothetical protein
MFDSSSMILSCSTSLRQSSDDCRVYSASSFAFFHLPVALSTDVVLCYPFVAFQLLMISPEVMEHIPSIRAFVTKLASNSADL